MADKQEAQLTIEQATQADMVTVIGVLQDAAAWLKSRGLDSWDPNSFEPIIGPAIARQEAYLARLDGIPVGTFLLQWIDLPFWGEQPDDAGYLHKLAVARAGGGYKVGELMVAYAEKLVIERGRPFLRLDCDRRNEVINRYYQKLGFEWRGVSPPNAGFDANLYEKRLIG